VGPTKEGPHEFQKRLRIEYYVLCVPLFFFSKVSIISMVEIPQGGVVATVFKFSFPSLVRPTSLKH